MAWKDGRRPKEGLYYCPIKKVRRISHDNGLIRRQFHSSGHDYSTVVIRRQKEHGFGQSVSNGKASHSNEVSSPTKVGEWLIEMMLKNKGRNQCRSVKPCQ
jgi:hypothetical protein